MGSRQADPTAGRVSRHDRRCRGGHHDPGYRAFQHDRGCHHVAADYQRDGRLTGADLDYRRAVVVIDPRTANGRDRVDRTGRAPAWPRACYGQPKADPAEVPLVVSARTAIVVGLQRAARLQVDPVSTGPV